MWTHCSLDEHFHLTPHYSLLKLEDGERLSPQLWSQQGNNVQEGEGTDGNNVIQTQININLKKTCTTFSAAAHERMWVTINFTSQPY